MKLRALVVEDSEDDLFLLLRALKAGGFAVEHKQVQGEEEYLEALKENWDVIISDYSLPRFNGVRAANIAREKNLLIPFFVVSGTIGEATAVEVMKAGAHDYVMKGNLIRLVPAINRELREFELKRKMHQELQEKEEQLRQSQKMEAIGRLAGGIAHDFNNLLGVLMLAAEKVHSKISKDKVLADDVEQIQMIVQRATALTRQLLTFSRKQIIEPKAVDINSMVTQTQKLFVRLLGEDIKFETILQKNLPPVRIDPTQLEQVIMNLVVNARDAMPRGGTLIIKTKKTDFLGQPHVEISVFDSGHGMDEETKKHIFEPFFTTKGPETGTGLGLSNVFGIVKQANGQIQVSSEVSKGTEFRVYLPALDQPADIEKVSVKSNESLEGSENILLVEDQAELRAVIADALETYKYKVLTANSPEDAIKKAQSDGHKIDLLLTDLVMPEMNGYELAEILHKKRPDIKVLLMSGYLDDRLLQFSETSQFKNFIQKPFSSQELLRKLRKVLS